MADGVEPAEAGNFRDLAFGASESGGSGGAGTGGITGSQEGEAVSSVQAEHDASSPCSRVDGRGGGGREDGGTGSGGLSAASTLWSGEREEEMDACVDDAPSGAVASSPGGGADNQVGIDVYVYIYV